MGNRAGAACAPWDFISPPPFFFLNHLAGPLVGLYSSAVLQFLFMSSAH